jgi:hypothetical protein
MRTLRYAFVFAVLCLLAPVAVSAQDAQEDWGTKTGFIGVGVDRLVTNGTGLSVRLFPIDVVGIELMFGTDIASTRVRNDDADLDNRTSERDLGLSLLGEFRMVTSNRANLGAYLGFGFTTHGRSTTDVDGDKVVDGYNDIAVELGLRGEFFVYRFFSIFGRVGLTLDPVNDQQIEFEQGLDADNATKYSGMNVDILRGDLLGAFGFTFWIPTGR